MNECGTNIQRRAWSVSGALTLSSGRSCLELSAKVDSNVPSTSRLRYNVTDLALELAGKVQRIEKLESSLEQSSSLLGGKRAG